MIGDSFNFGQYNSRKDWGIKVIATDVLLPPKKSRKLNIPGKHGQYTPKEIIYDERIIEIRCILENKISRAELREIAYSLSNRRRLILWNEPDKFYNAEIYDPAEIMDLPKEIMREFTLYFICEPFAYKDLTVSVLKDGKNKIDYNGTFNAETSIRLTNTGTTDISNIQIIATRRR